MINKGNHQKAINHISKYTKQNEISKEDHFSFNVLKAEILNDLHKSEEALGIVDEILSKLKEEEKSLVFLDALIQKGVAFLSLGRLDDTLKIVNISEEYLQDLKELPYKKIAQRKAKILLTKAMVFAFKSETEREIDCFKQSLIFAEEAENSFIISMARGHICYYYGLLKDEEKAKENYEIAYNIGKTLGNKRLIKHAYGSIAVFYSMSRDFNQALQYFNKQIKIAEELNMTTELSTIYNNMSVCYRFMFDYRKSLEFLLKALPYYKEDRKYLTLYNIGLVYHNLGELESALEYFQKSLKIAEKIKSKMIYHHFYQLFLVSTDLENIHLAEEYLEYLQKTSQENDNENAKFYFRIAKANFLKESPEVENWFKARAIYNELLETTIDPKWRATFTFFLLTIKVKELQISPDQTKYIEILDQLNNLKAISEENQYYVFLTDILRLESQLVLLELDIELARKLLDDAYAIAKEKELGIELKEIQKEKKKLKKQYSILVDLKNQKTSMKDSLNQVSLQKTIKRISKETAFEERDKETGEVIEIRKLFDLKI